MSLRCYQLSQYLPLSVYSSTANATGEKVTDRHLSSFNDVQTVSSVVDDPAVVEEITHLSKR